MGIIDKKVIDKYENLYRHKHFNEREDDLPIEQKVDFYRKRNLSCNVFKFEVVNPKDYYKYGRTVTNDETGEEEFKSYTEKYYTFDFVIYPTYNRRDYLIFKRLLNKNKEYSPMIYVLILHDKEHETTLQIAMTQNANVLLDDLLANTRKYGIIREHMHVVVYFKKNRTMQNVSKMFELPIFPHFTLPREDDTREYSLISRLLYIIHRDEFDKVPYDLEDVYGTPELIEKLQKYTSKDKSWELCQYEYLKWLESRQYVTSLMTYNWFKKYGYMDFYNSRSNKYFINTVTQEHNISHGFTTSFFYKNRWCEEVRNGILVGLNDNGFDLRHYTNKKIN